MNVYVCKHQPWLLWWYCNRNSRNDHSMSEWLCIMMRSEIHRKQTDIFSITWICTHDSKKKHAEKKKGTERKRKQEQNDTQQREKTIQLFSLNYESRFVCTHKISHEYVEKCFAKPHKMIFVQIQAQKISIHHTVNLNIIYYDEFECGKIFQENKMISDTIPREQKRYGRCFLLLLFLLLLWLLVLLSSYLLIW